MIGYAKYFDDNKTMSFKLSDKNLLKKYTKILEKISSLMNTEFDTELLYVDGDKYVKEKEKKRKYFTQVFVTDNARFFF